MTLADGLQKLQQFNESKKVSPCHFILFLSKLPKDDQKTLLELISGSLSSRVILRLLASEGYKISQERFNDHRGKRCRCPKGDSK